MAIAVHIALSDVAGLFAAHNFSGGLEGAVAVAVVDADEIHLQRVEGDGEVQVVIAVVIARNQPRRCAGGLVRLRRFKGAVAVSQKNNQLVEPQGHRQVRLAIIVEVAGGDGDRQFAGLHPVEYFEHAVFLSEDDGEIAVAVIADRNVGNAVAVEIRHRQGHRFAAGAHHERFLEGAVAVALKKHQRVVIGVRHQQVRKLVVVHVVGDQGGGLVADLVGRGQGERLGIPRAGTASRRKIEYRRSDKTNQYQASHSDSRRCQCG